MPPPLCDTLSRIPFRRLNPSMCNPYLGLGLCIIDIVPICILTSRNVFKLVDSLLFPTTLMKNSSDPLLLPLMMQSLHESETHYYPLTCFNQRRILLHAHSSAPFSYAGSTRGLNFTIYSLGTAGCSINFGGSPNRLEDNIWKMGF